MSVRAWATLAVRCFALYHLIVSGATVLWTLLNSIMSSLGIPPGHTRAFDDEPLSRAILYSALWFGIAMAMLVYSDGIIRWIARVPGESPEKPA